MVICNTILLFNGPFLLIDLFNINLYSECSYKFLYIVKTFVVLYGV